MDWKKEEEWRLWKKSAAELALRAPPPPLLPSSILQLLLSITQLTEASFTIPLSLFYQFLPRSLHTPINDDHPHITIKSCYSLAFGSEGESTIFSDAPFRYCGLIGHHLDRQTCTAVPGFGLPVLSYPALVAAAAVLIFVCKFRRCQLAVGPRWPNKCNSENYFQLRNHSSFYLFSYRAIPYVS